MAMKTTEQDNAEALAQFDQLPGSAYVRLPVVRGVNGNVSAMTIYRWIKEGRFPAPVKLGPGVSAWRVADIRDHLASKVAA